eukprot:CAMPEP_0174256094 /NCGR_PEP_ID=MMETSP0439-20130205/5351_1 /TAXON_ID=0 /ORGANISM="Stereomyxa ramosa, Strain Chinc5" /LENGTH=346 /DNA_ID=CAMNT_0015338553 /DNA_START=295 /DNA_END=1332 /DNA_ORIENTATION=+
MEKNNDASQSTSESTGYGMLISCFMAGYDDNARTYFDGFFYFVDDYPSNIDDRLAKWQYFPASPNAETDSAFDGDMDMAYALIMADLQWGSDGDIDYAAEAQEILDGIFESTIGPDSLLPMLGDWVDPSGGTHNQYTPRSSDMALGHFKVFADFDDSHDWDGVVEACQELLASFQDDHSTSGLHSDFIVNGAPATAGFLEGDNDGNYYYNAGRNPWRFATDFVLNNDATTKEIIVKFMDFISEDISNNDPEDIASGYYLDGNPIDTSYVTTFFVCPFGVGAMVDSDYQSLLNNVWDFCSDTSEDYFEDSVNLLSLLVMSGNFWDSNVGNGGVGDGSSASALSSSFF